MCSPELIKKIDAGKVIIFPKSNTIISIAIIFAAIIVAFTTTKLQAISNEKRITCLEQEHQVVDEIYFNLRHLFMENDWKWVANKED